MLRQTALLVDLFDTLLQGKNNLWVQRLWNPVKRHNTNDTRAAVDQGGRQAAGGSLHKKISWEKWCPLPFATTCLKHLRQIDCHIKTALQHSGCHQFFLRLCMDHIPGDVIVRAVHTFTIFLILTD